MATFNTVQSINCKLSNLSLKNCAVIDQIITLHATWFGKSAFCFEACILRFCAIQLSTASFFWFIANSHVNNAIWNGIV